MGALLPFFVEHDFGQPSCLCNEPLQAHLSESPLPLTDSQKTAVLLILLYSVTDFVTSHFVTNFVLNCIVFVLGSM